jgi:hypothetical protein
MSWSIPQQIEKDIIAGKARYQTFQTGSGGQSILPVPPNSYAVIFGYDFSPAGGGFKTQALQDSQTVLHPDVIRWFETQQISFYTGNDFFPFIHHVNVEVTSFFVAGSGAFYAFSIDNTPIARQIYITSTNDIAVSVGLILNNRVATQNAIPVTNRTPLGLTYGGSGQVINTQTDFGPAVTPQQFMQPSPKDYQDFAFGLLPSNADGQAFATPDVTNGLRDASQYLNSIDPTYASAASANYYLNLHYVLYTETVPEQRG